MRRAYRRHCTDEQGSRTRCRSVQISRHEIYPASFQVPVCSTEKSVVELISNKQITPLPHTNVCFCTDTPEGGLTAEAVLIHSDVKTMGVIGEIYPISDKCIKTDIKGKIVVIERSVLMDYPDIDTYKVLENISPLP